MKRYKKKHTKMFLNGSVLLALTLSIIGAVFMILSMIEFREKTQHNQRRVPPKRYKVQIWPEHEPWSDCTVVIPCTARHLKKIHVSLESVEYQWAKPKEVILAVSECTDSDKVQNIISQYMPSVPCRITVVSEKANAAMNRNRATRMVKTHYVSYMDADDAMHPMYLSVIAAWVYTYPETKVLYHGFDSQQKNLDMLCYISNRQDLETNSKSSLGLTLPGHFSYGIHHGHVTVLTRIAIKYPQQESWTMSTQEDSIWSHTLLENTDQDNAFSVMYLDLPLSIYICDAHQPDGEAYRVKPLPFSDKFPVIRIP